MKNDGYQQFFNRARDLKQPERKATKPRPSLPLTLDTEEQVLRKALQVKKRKRLPFPWKAVVSLFACLGIVGFYLNSPELVERWLARIEIGAFGQAQAADNEAGAKPGSAAEKSSSTSAEGEKATATDDKSKAAKSTGEKTASNEEFSQFTKLKQRKEELDEREKELNELEEELQRQKVELDKRITQLEEMRNQISQTLKERVDIDQEKVNKLVDLYSNMKPKQAADIIGSLNEELAVEVLAKMKKKNAAEVMNLLSPEKAKILSEKYTGYRRISSQEPRG